MRISVGIETHASTQAQLDYRCGACGHRQRAEVVGIGRGMQSVVNAPGTAERRARENARHELARTLRFATCPRCGQRSGYLRFMAPYLWAFGITVVLGVIGGYAPTWLNLNMSPGDKQLCATYVTLGLAAIGLLVAGGGLWVRWATNDRGVRWLDDAG